MTPRSDPNPSCGWCHGSGIVSVSKDPDEIGDCVCTDLPRAICPECRDGKHGNCIHEAMSADDEILDYCACECETARTCPSCRDIVPAGWTLDDHFNCNWPEDHE